MSTTTRNGLTSGLFFQDGYSQVTGSYRFAADEMGTRYLFDISPVDLLEIFQTSDRAEQERILRDRRDLFLAACQRAFDERESSRLANVELRLKAAHFQV